jgi:SRSO17 transposase
MKETTVPKASPAPLPELAAFLHPYAPLFHNRQSWQSVERYLTGLLTDLPRKNCDTIAAAIAQTSTERLQHLLTDAIWDPQALDQARVQHLAAHSPRAGVLLLDDTGLPKQGKASAGVARQYSGTLGKVGNCQVLVSAEYVADDPTTSMPLHWPVSAQLFLPEPWATDAVRRKRAHIPAALPAQTKLEVALHLVDRARAWAVPFAVVVTDAGYGDTPDFLAGLEAREVAYVCGVHATFGLRLPTEVAAQAVAPPPPYRGRGQPPKPRPAPLYTAQQLTEAIPAAQWRTVCWRERGADQPLAKQVVALRVQWATGSPEHFSASHPRVRTGPEGWLIGERPLPGERGDPKWYVSNLPPETSWERLITLAHTRWAIEQFYEDAKGECGLDDYQGRRWDGLHRHVALCMLAYSFLVHHRLQTDTSAGGFSPLSAAPQPAGGPPGGPALAVPGCGALAHCHRSNPVFSPSEKLTM